MPADYDNLHDNYSSTLQRSMQMDVERGIAKLDADLRHLHGRDDHNDDNDNDNELYFDQFQHDLEHNQFDDDFHVDYDDERRHDYLDQFHDDDHAGARLLVRRSAVLRDDGWRVHLYKLRRGPKSPTAGRLHDDDDQHDDHASAVRKYLPIQMHAQRLGDRVQQLQ